MIEAVVDMLLSGGGVELATPNTKIKVVNTLERRLAAAAEKVCVLVRLYRHCLPCPSAHACVATCSCRCFPRQDVLRLSLIQTDIGTTKFECTSYLGLLTVFSRDYR